MIKTSLSVPKPALFTRVGGFTDRGTEGMLVKNGKLPAAGHLNPWDTSIRFQLEPTYGSSSFDGAADWAGGKRVTVGSLLS
jgi:hypothetical protein